MTLSLKNLNKCSQPYRSRSSSMTPWVIVWPKNRSEQSTSNFTNWRLNWAKQLTTNRHTWVKFKISSCWSWRKLMSKGVWPKKHGKQSRSLSRGSKSKLKVRRKNGRRWLLIWMSNLTVSGRRCLARLKVSKNKGFRLKKSLYNYLKTPVPGLSAN